MKYVPIISAISVAVLYIVVGVPPSVYSKAACAALGVALLYFGHRAMASRAPTILADESGRPLDNDLVARVLEKLKREPSEQLREMLAESSPGKWSPEALQAARMLLEQRADKGAAEPVYRTVPRAQQDQSARESEAAAPGISREILALDVGSRVYCGWRNQAGTIIRWQDEEERFYIRFDDGEGEWATLGMFE